MNSLNELNDVLCEPLGDYETEKSNIDELVTSYLGDTKTVM